ncbi:hypothetical protein RH858_12285 [Halalkaliarchaeum sp. AArc-GB]|uniref:hypothetical protein n=1 Tax=Halalkaliarchaeum sp. AArc-GB TaxID=3074078 RepID=UPI0028547351|nr:hypothetical protein [Halalkaliarchaeum sp. AArc-GB]MDR5673922.1 hypothetical protein [Halalkaliarchaeum sp. AArc-GB]
MTDFRGVAKLLLQLVGYQLPSTSNSVLPDTEDIIRAIFDMADRRAADIIDILQRLSIFVEMYLQDSGDRSFLEFWLPNHDRHVEAVLREQGLPRAVAVRTRFLSSVTDAFSSHYIQDSIYPELQQDLVSDTVLDCAREVLTEDVNLSEIHMDYELSDEQIELLRDAFDELADVNIPNNG